MMSRGLVDCVAGVSAALCIMLVGGTSAWADPDSECCFEVTRVEGWDTLNMRSGPGVRNEIVGELPHNADGVWLSQCEGQKPASQIAQELREGTTFSSTWCEVEYSPEYTPNFFSGWVNIHYLRASNERRETRSSFYSACVEDDGVPERCACLDDMLREQMPPRIMSKIDEDFASGGDFLNDQSSLIQKLTLNEMMVFEETLNGITLSCLLGVDISEFE